MTEFTTPVGRYVSGDLFTPDTKDNKGNPLTDKQGQPTQRYNFGLAIPKASAGWAELYQQIAAEAKAGHPQLFANGMPQSFAWKITDGDSQVPNGAGNRPCDKVEWVGCYIMWFSGSYAPKCCDENWALITDSNELKRGYYIRVVGSTKPNDDAMKPGVYLNYAGIQRCAYGEAITGGIDLKQAFATPVGALPQGASATPLAPTAPAPATSPMAPAGLPAPGLPGAPAANTTMPAPAFQPPPVNAAPMPGALPAPGAIPAPGAVAAQPVHDFMEEAKYIVPGMAAPVLESALRAADYTDAHLAQLQKA